ncbi:MAG: hypothetical protein D6701_00635 [Gemmatimonadetes bacterium]|nr:MAG: hypothetical protein D6701_00635 [Gemmatimonadota bacterium]
MLRNVRRTLRYARTWLTGHAPVHEYEALVDRGDREVPVSVLHPRRERRGRPGWVVLHGITRPGRFHPTLHRFTRSVASTGAVVVVPQVPEWKDLRLAPELTLPTVRAALDLLASHPETGEGPYGLIGFSFGCPQALIAASEPDVGDRLAQVVGFGGYCDMARTVRFQMTGEHEWAGTRHRLRPDPYGRWIIGGNHLATIPDYRDAADVADALWRLAVEAGERRILSWDPSYDPLKRRLRDGVAPERRWLFDLFAPLSSEEPDPALAEEVTRKLSRAVLDVSPLMNPVPYLERIRPTVRLIHGKADHLIPFTETLRLAAAFPEGRPVDTTITALFAHSEQEGRLSSLRREVREGLRLAGALGRVLGTLR